MDQNSYFESSWSLEAFYHLINTKLVQETGEQGGRSGAKETFLADNSRNILSGSFYEVNFPKAFFLKCEFLMGLLNYP